MREPPSYPDMPPPSEPIDAAWRRDMAERAERIRAGIPCAPVTEMLWQSAQHMDRVRRGLEQASKCQIEAAKLVEKLCKTLLTFGLAPPSKTVELTVDESLGDLAQLLEKGRQRANAATVNGSGTHSSQRQH